VSLLSEPIIESRKSREGLFDIVSARASMGDITSIIVASRSGKSALEMANKIKGVTIISVTEFEYDDNVKKDMKKLNVIYIERPSLPIQDLLGVKEALLLFGAGVKSAVEVSAIAAEKELITGNVISVAGSKGIDTALVIKPSKASDISNPDPTKRMEILEILAFPHRR
jgi:hypothetical protein